MLLHVPHEEGLICLNQHLKSRPLGYVFLFYVALHAFPDNQPTTPAPNSSGNSNDASRSGLATFEFDKQAALRFYGRAIRRKAAMSLLHFEGGQDGGLGLDPSVTLSSCVQGAQAWYKDLVITVNAAAHQQDTRFPILPTVQTLSRPPFKAHNSS